MSDDSIDNVPESAGGSQPSRRGFIHGTAAAAAGVALSGRLAVGPRGARPTTASRSDAGVAGSPPRSTSAADANADAEAAGSGTDWVFIQAGPQRHGTGSVSLTMPAASTAGTLLLATVLSTDSATAFTPPPGWRLAKAAPAAPGGRAEIWYYPGIPPAPGNPGGIGTAAKPATFTSSGGADCRGAMAEFGMPSGTMPVLDAPGVGSGASGGFALTAASGNISGDLGIALAADFFSGQPSSGSRWTGPSGSGWTSIRRLDGGAPDPWAAWYDLSLGAGPQALQARYSQPSGVEHPSQLGWAFAFAAFRPVRFQSLHLDGGEVTTMVALDPTGQELIMGGDVEGLWRTADFGDHWQLSQDGLYGQHWRSVACVAWSELEPGHVYACVGSDAKGNGDGGFLVSPDGGVSWSMRSTAVQFQGNDAGSPPRPAAEGQDTDRSVGHLLVQDSQPQGTPSYLYAASYSGGVFRSADAGHHWSNIGLSGGKYYARAIVINPANPKELWVATWDWESTHSYGGVWHCPNVDKPSWRRLAGFPTASGAQFGTVADLKLLGGYLYAACPLLGIFRHPIGGQGWTSLNGGPVTTGSSGPLWTSIDGYQDATSGDHVIVAACGSGVALGKNLNRTNVVKLAIDPAGHVTATDLTGGANTDFATIPPDNQPWWRHGSSYHNWLGGKDFHNAHVLIDPNDHRRLYVTGGGGFFRTYNADASPENVTWAVAVNGAPMSAIHLIAVDPQNPDHVILAGSDFTQTDLTDPTGWNTAGVHAAAVTLPVHNVESHAIAFDPHSNLFTGVNAKYGKNSGGAVYWRASGDSTYSWHDTGYPVSKAPLGIFAGLDSGGTYIVVVTQGADVRRGTPSEPTMLRPWTWETLHTGIGAKGAIAQHCPIVAGTSAGYLFCFDRKQGIFRSADNGKSWTFIWNTVSFGLTVSDARSGWLAANPAVDGELWVCTNDPGSPYRLSGVNSGKVGNSQVKSMSAGSFPNGAGGIAFTPAGQPYAVALNGPLPASGPLSSARLLTLPGGSTTWKDAGGDSVGSYASWPECVVMNSNGLILIGSDEDFGVYGFPISS